MLNPPIPTISPATQSPTLLRIKSRVPAESFNVIHSFLSSLYSPRSRDTYLFGLAGFIASTGIDPMQASADHLARFVREKIEAGAKPATIKAKVNSVRSLAKYAAENLPGHVNRLDRFRLKIPMNQGEDGFRISSRILAPEQVATVIDRIDRAEKESGKTVTGAFLFRFLLESGMRISELVSLDHHDSAKDSPHYVNYLRRDRDRWVVRVLGKGRKLREFKLSRSFGAMLAERFAHAVPGTPLFTSARRTRLTRFAARYRILEIHRRFMADFRLHGFGCHALRHTTISNLLTVRGEHPIHISRVVGNTPEILARYYLHSSKDLFKDFSLTDPGGAE